MLDRAGITCNRNQIPDDPRPPFVTSGLRLGTAAETTAGMGEAEMATVAELIARTLKCHDDEAALAGVRAEVAELCGRFDPYPAGGGAGGVRRDRRRRRAEAAVGGGPRVVVLPRRPPRCQDWRPE